VTTIDAVARVDSDDLVTSPLSGLRGAFVHVTVLEARGAAIEVIGAITLGDLVRFRFGDGRAIDVVVRRATCVFPEGRTAVLVHMPPEIVAVCARARGGVLHTREHVVRRGDAIRVRVAGGGGGEKVRLSVPV